MEKRNAISKNASTQYNAVFSEEIQGVINNAHLFTDSGNKINLQLVPLNLNVYQRMIQLLLQPEIKVVAQLEHELSKIIEFLENYITRGQKLEEIIGNNEIKITPYKTAIGLPKNYEKPWISFTFTKTNNSLKIKDLYNSAGNPEYIEFYYFWDDEFIKAMKMDKEVENIDNLMDEISRQVSNNLSSEEFHDIYKDENSLINANSNLLDTIVTKALKQTSTLKFPSKEAKEDKKSQKMTKKK